MQEYDACRLLALNLFNFVEKPFTKDATLNLDKLYEVAYEQQRLADNLVDLELGHIERILAKLESDPEPQEVKRSEIELWTKIKQTAQNSRRTGSGFTALGDTLAGLGISYDSDESLAVIEQLMHTKFKAELDCTIDLAVTRGTFKGWDSSLEYSDDFEVEGKNHFYTFLAKRFPEQYERMKQYGRRNVSWSTVNGGFTK